MSRALRRSRPGSEHRSLTAAADAATAPADWSLRSAYTLRSRARRRIVEAVVLDSNPGRIKAELPVVLGRSRDRKAPEFVGLVEHIYPLDDRASGAAIHADRGCAADTGVGSPAARKRGRVVGPGRDHGPPRPAERRRAGRRAVPRGRRPVAAHRRARVVGVSSGGGGADGAHGLGTTRCASGSSAMCCGERSARPRPTLSWTWRSTGAATPHYVKQPPTAPLRGPLGGTPRQRRRPVSGREGLPELRADPCGGSLMTTACP